MIAIDGPLKRIFVSGVSTQDVQEVYSEWKRWVLQTNNLKYDRAFRVIGGEGIGGGQKSPAYFFLMNNWKVVVDGESVIFSYNLYCDENSNTNTDQFILLNGAAVSNTISTSPATGSSLSDNDKIDNANKVAERVYENGMTLEQMLRIIFSAVAGSSYGAGTMNFGYKSANGSKNRIESSVDGSGNRIVNSVDGI